MQKAIDKLRAYMAAGDWRAALKLAAAWPRLGEHKEAIQRGWAAMSNRVFYTELGMDPDACIAEGVAALKEALRVTIEQLLQDKAPSEYPITITKLAEWALRYKMAADERDFIDNVLGPWMRDNEELWWGKHWRGVGDGKLNVRVGNRCVGRVSWAAHRRMKAGWRGEGLLGEDMTPSLGPLKERFGWPPFSVINTRDGEWVARRRKWIALGIKSEEGCKDGLTFKIPLNMNKIAAQTSVFDPALCDILYEWFAPPGGVVLDPFAGGSVRGIVASCKGLKYYGIELRAEAVESNRSQIKPYNTGRWAPKWRVGDAAEAVPRAPLADFVFTCPPYGNLEKYSDDPRDISNMPYDGFMERYAAIIAATVARLREDRFVAWVVANYREAGGGGMLRDLVGDTIRAFAAVGAGYYNEAALINAVGSGAMRSNTTFMRGARKLVKSHQNVLVFVKGDPTRAAANVGTWETTPEGGE